MEIPQPRDAMLHEWRQRQTVAVLREQLGMAVHHPSFSLLWFAEPDALVHRVQGCLTIHSSEESPQCPQCQLHASVLTDALDSGRLDLLRLVFPGLGEG